LANEEGGFVDRLSAAGLDQSRGLPGFEIARQPPIDENGIYLFRTGGTDAAEGSLVVHVIEEHGQRISGTIEFPFRAKIRQEYLADVSTHIVPGTTPPRSVATFETTGSGRFILEPTQMAAPVEVEIDGEYPASKIFVGPWRSSPQERRFTLQLRDRHGIAWGDYNGDGATDALIVRGGLKGKLAKFADGVIADELMIGGGPSFVDVIAGSGLVKGACRGRETAPVDFDRDGRLDLSWGCESASPMLFRQLPDGTFVNASAGLQRARVRGDHDVWIDIVGDPRQELIVERGHKLVTYRQKRGERWKRLDTVATFGESLERVIYSDFDNDGDLDLFSAAPDGNTLLVNRSGRLKPRRPRRFDLPNAGSVAASWVDYDNDGRTDLYTTPQGLFKRDSERRFHATGIGRLPGSPEDALATWFDYDNDGARDLALAIGHKGWRFKLLHNLTASNHWLEVELTGHLGAYPVPGTSVTVTAGGRRQTRWVGESDGARYSSGHHRLYFGLADVELVQELEVRWPDGTTQTLRDLAADRLVRVSFEPS
jgi:hypothetical protein